MGVHTDKRAGRLQGRAGAKASEGTDVNPRQRPGAPRVAQLSPPARDALTRARQRLQDICDLSKLLANTEDIGQSLPELATVVSRTLPLRSLVLLFDEGTGLKSVLWAAEGLHQGGAQTATENAALVFSHIVGAKTSTWVDCSSVRPASPVALPWHGPAPISTIGQKNSVVLPLVVERHSIFGVLQVEGVTALGGEDLAFVSAVSNQIAIALRLRTAQPAPPGSTARASHAGVDNLDHAFAWEADAGTLAFSYVGGRGEELFGYSSDAWLGRSEFLLQWVHIDDRALVLEVFRKALSGTDQRCDHRCLAADGRVLWLHTAIHATRHGKGKPRLQGVSVDITELKGAEQSVEDRLGFTLALTGSLGESIVALDLEQRLTFVNPAAERLLGWSSDEAIGKRLCDISELRRPDGVVIAAADWLSAQAEASVHPIVDESCVLLGRDRAARPCSYAVSAIRREGRVEGVVITFRHVVSPRRGEVMNKFLAEMTEALASSLDFACTAEAIARIPVPFFADVCFLDMIEPDGEVSRRAISFADEKLRPLAERLRRYAPRAGWHTPEALVLSSGKPAFFSELPGFVLDEIGHDRKHVEILKLIGLRSMLVAPLIARGRTIGVITFGASEVGRRYSWSDVAFAEEVAQRAASAIDNALLLDEAHKAVTNRQDILCVVSHDLQNPLSAILLSAALLLQRRPTDDNVQDERKKLEVIKRSAERMTRMLKDLLDVSSIDAGHLSIQRSHHPVHELLQEVAEAQAPLAAEKDVSLEVRVPAQPLCLQCDWGRVIQVLSNLVGNAIKFTPSGGRIVLRADGQGSSVRFAVADSGPGIAEQHLAHVFDRYWQASATASKGKGLGLYISKGIVEAHGGECWVESREGEGSTFFFTLPIASTTPLGSQLERCSIEHRPARATHKVRGQEPSARADPAPLALVVDDDESMRALLAELLKHEGYRTVTAGDGREALACLRAGPTPALIVLDLVMPRMNGWQFLAEKRRDPALRSIPVIVASGDEQARDKVAATEAEYVSKPISPIELLRSIENLLPRGKQGRSLEA